MIPDPAKDEVRQQALAALIAQFVQQGHPEQYAQHMATLVIFQTDLELRNAQMTKLLGWLKQEHAEIYNRAAELVEEVRVEFENRLSQ